MGAQLILRTITVIALAQMLPPSAVKGGTAMRLRLGVTNSRFSKDLDLARRQELNDFLADYSARLRDGWAGFTGEIRENRARSKPAGVPGAYIMESRDIKVSYARKNLMTVLLEIGHDELDDTLDPPRVLSEDIQSLFRDLGLPPPSPVPVVAEDHQIAQKLHAVSGVDSERAHDLVDLQLLAATCTASDADLGTLAARLFTFRRAHAWPPRVEPGRDWESLYASAAEGLDVLPGLPAAIAWVNAYIARLDAARGHQPGQLTGPVTR